MLGLGGLDFTFRSRPVGLKVLAYRSGHNAVREPMKEWKIPAAVLWGVTILTFFAIFPFSLLLGFGISGGPTEIPKDKWLLYAFRSSVTLGLPIWLPITILCAVVIFWRSPKR